MLINVGQTQI